MKVSSSFLFAFLLLSVIGVFSAQAQDSLKFRNHQLPVVERIRNLISRLTQEEKVLQLQNDAPAIPRLGIPAYNWWNECLHGVGRNGIATVFPQAIGMAATWDPDLIFREADVISTEARAKYNEARKKGFTGNYEGLTFLSPNINIFRDPRWGRGQETYGEDPFLTGTIGVAFVKGLQGNDPKYLKVVATAKHFAVHSGPESTRHSFDAWCSDRDLFETYLPAFEMLVKEGHVASVMGAYNRFRNEPCCSNNFLLRDILRKSWGFEGYVVTDCGAIWDIFNGHELQPDAIRSSAMTLNAGCDLTCGDEYQELLKAKESGYVRQVTIDQSLERLFTARFRLGMFDPDSIVPYSDITGTSLDTPSNRELAAKVARESIVLLMNNGILPLSENTGPVAIIGPYADNLNVLLGNYNGTPSQPVTLLQGIRNIIKNKKAIYAKGIPAFEEIDFSKNVIDWMPLEMQRQAMDAAQKSKVIIFVGGISPGLEGEALKVEIHGFSGGDRTNLELPNNQKFLLKKLKETGKPIILVLTGGSALALDWEKENCSAILQVWYPGEEGGNAVADVLFGKYNPAGRLPVTFYSSLNDLPLFEDYSMKGRTYKYFEGEPLFAFGHGLSYTHFQYEHFALSKSIISSEDSLLVEITLKNTGRVDGEEVIQLYSAKPDSRVGQPLRKLIGFRRVFLKKGEEKVVVLPVYVSNLRYYDSERQKYRVEAGIYTLLIGGASDDIRLKGEIRVNPE